MLVLRRKLEQVVVISDPATGKSCRVRVGRIRDGYPASIDLIFDDPANHFAFDREEVAAERAAARAAAAAQAEAGRGHRPSGQSHSGREAFTST